MNIYNTKQIAAIHRKMLEKTGRNDRDLLISIADQVACEIAERWDSRKPLMVFAGPGKKGAAALSVAYILADSRGFKTEVYIVNRGGDQLCEDTAFFRDELLNNVKYGVKVTEFIKEITLPVIKPNYLVIDGLFGPEESNAVQGGLKNLIDTINRASNDGATTISIENPSGLPGDLTENIINSNCISADFTFAIHRQYPSFFLDDVAEVLGEVVVLDVGLPELTKEDGQDCNIRLIDEMDVHALLFRRPLNVCKADFGNGLIIAGQYGMIGAAILSARGALRSGIGKLTVMAPRCAFSILQTAVPEALFRAGKHDFFINDLDIGDKPGSRTRYDSIAIGPGIGTHEDTVKALELFLTKYPEQPLVLDADALNCISSCPRLLNLLPKHCIITPHKGEFDRLFGAHSSDRERLLKAVDAARQCKIIIVLKGHHTAIVLPNGKIFICSNGTPAMATAGSGDVLTGMIMSFLAQGYNTLKSAVLAAYLHGEAGKLAEEIHGTYGVTASDIADNIGKAIKNYLR